MDKKKILSTLLIITITILTLAQFAPNFLLPPKTNAVVGGGNHAILGLFYEPKKSNNVFDTAIGNNGLFTLDVNVTDVVLLKAFDINITFAPLTLQYAGSSIKAPNCSTCLLASIGITIPTGGNQSDNMRGWTRLNVIDTDAGTPFFGGTGILFRVVFRALTAGSTGVPIRITAGSTLQNPSSVPYDKIDGYFANGSPVYNFGIGLSPTSLSVTRPVSGTVQTAIMTGTLTRTAGSLSLVDNTTVIGLPKGATPVYTTATSCTPAASACTVSLRIQITGGASGGPTTTPSGVYRLVLLGRNQTNITPVAAGPLTASAWFTLTVTPPAAPVFSISAQATKIRVDDGNFSAQTVTATLSSGSPDTFSWSTNISTTLPSCAADFNPIQSPTYPVSSSMNVTCLATAPLTNTGNFTLTGQTQGTYSEVVVTHTILIKVNVTRTHDMVAVTTAISKGFSYAGVSLGSSGIKFNVTVSNFGSATDTSTVNGTAKTKLVPDSHIGFLDKNGDSLWDPGESVTYDADGRSGPPSIGSALKTDSHIKYVDTNGNNVWNNGEAVVSDSNLDNLYNAGEPAISNSTVIPNGTPVKTDPLLKYVDVNGDNAWEVGEPVVDDADSGNTYTFADTVIVNGFLTWVPGEPIIANSTVIPVGAFLKTDPKIKLVDSHYNGKWTSGDAVAYDGNGNGLYDAIEVMVAGARPSPGFLVGSQSVTLTGGQANFKVTLNWDTSSLPRATYQIQGSIAPVPKEYITLNNNVAITSFTQRLKGDVSGDCKVDIVDLATVGSTFGKTLGTAGYNAAADLNNDGTINIVDLVLVAGSFGTSC